VEVAAGNPRPATNALGWLADNLARFIATWVSVGGLVAAAIIIVEGDRWTAPRSLDEILGVPAFLVVFPLIAAFVATVGLFLFALGWIPGLVVYLVALWWCGRALPSHLRRAAAIALSPLVVALFFMSGIQAVELQLAALAGALVYGCIVKLPAAPDGAQRAQRA
jgi:hypothetical protein